MKWFVFICTLAKKANQCLFTGNTHTNGLRHAPLPWLLRSPAALGQRLPAVLVAPLPVWVGPEVGLLHLEEDTRSLSLCSSGCSFLQTTENQLKNHVCTWKARSWYCCFSLGPRAYHHSPRILLTVRLSWLGCRWCTRARWRLLKIMNAFMGRRMWSFSLWLCYERNVSLLN